eukprot:5604479-Lingulodinium_polyedra.AAC.1
MAISSFCRTVCSTKSQGTRITQTRVDCSCTLARNLHCATELNTLAVPSSASDQSRTAATATSRANFVVD